MRTPERTFRKITYLLLALTISAALAACGGGGGSSTSSGTSGPVTVSVSVASTPSYPAGTTFAITTASPTGTSAPSVITPPFAHVWVRVNRIALIPVDSIPFMERNKPHQDGELEEEDTAESNNGFVTETLNPPKTIDLLDPPSGAKILNRFPSVPAGEYGKIRVYYDSVVGEPLIGDNVLFHPTAHYHFDVHFVGGNLVVPVSSDPSGGIRFFQVDIGVVGLKIHQAGNSGKVLLRPQVFAEVVGAPEYIVTGVAEQVNHSAGTFNVITAGNDNISAAYGSETRWYYVDGRYVGPFGISGADALRDTALVDVIGTFQSGALTATRVDITFPNSRTGTADNVWILSNTAFIVRSEADNDNVTVFPMPDRSGAYYDNSMSPLPPLTFAAIDNNIKVKVRGYFATYPNLDAYWISIVP